MINSSSVKPCWGRSFDPDGMWTLHRSVVFKTFRLRGAYRKLLLDGHRSLRRRSRDACMPGSRAPPRVMVKGVARSTSPEKSWLPPHPGPKLRPAPGGRVAVICSVPLVSSSRCTSATAWPSCERKPPLETFTNCIRAGFVVQLHGHRINVFAPRRGAVHDNVPPLVAVMVAGSNIKLAPLAEGAGDAGFAGADLWGLTWSGRRRWS